MAGGAGDQVVFQRAPPPVVGDLLAVHRHVRHVAIGAGNAGRPVRAVVGEEFVLGMADEGQLEAGDRLRPFGVGRRTLHLLDDVLDADVADRAARPREDHVGRAHVLVFGDHVTYMALGADQGALVGGGQFRLVHADLLQGLAQGEAAGDLQGHATVVVTVDTGNAQGLLILGELRQHFLVGQREIVLAHLLLEYGRVRGLAGQAGPARLDAARIDLQLVLHHEEVPARLAVFVAEAPAVVEQRQERVLVQLVATLLAHVEALLVLAFARRSRLAGLTPESVLNRIGLAPVGRIDGAVGDLRRLHRLDLVLRASGPDRRGRQYRQNAAPFRILRLHVLPPVVGIGKPVTADDISSFNVCGTLTKATRKLLDESQDTSNDDGNGG